MKEVTDEQLMMLINAGDLQVMQVLFDRYSIRIYRYCVKVTNERMASEDLTQETFYKVMKHRQSFNSKTFAGWIFTIARNLCFDYLKKREKEGAKTTGLESYEENGRDDEALKVEQSQHLRESLAHLDPIEKELIILSRYEKLKYKEIAEIVNMTEAAIKNRVHRALKKLRLQYFKTI